MDVAGKSIEAFWKIFSIHNQQSVRDILSQYRIGHVAPEDIDSFAGDPTNDPFQHDPSRHESLVTRSAKPRNAESGVEALEPFVTDNEKFYVRNHLWVPLVKDVSKFRLVVDGVGVKDGELELSLEDLRDKFEKVCKISDVY